MLQGYGGVIGGHNAFCFIKKEWILMKLWPITCLASTTAAINGIQMDLGQQDILGQSVGHGNQNYCSWWTGKVV